MDKPELIKNISFSKAHFLRDLVDYQKGRVVSRTLAQNDALSLTLFAFDPGEGLGTHATPGDAMVQVLDGEVSLTIGGKEAPAKSGEVVVMPSDVPHSVNAVKPFKMLLTVVKKPKLDRPGRNKPLGEWKPLSGALNDPAARIFPCSTGLFTKPSVFFLTGSQDGL